MTRLALLEQRPELEDAIVEAVSRGVPLATAAHAAGMSDEQLGQWRNVARGSTCWSGGNPVSDESKHRIARLFARVAQAQAEHAARLVSQINEAGTQTNLKTGLREWRADAWMLEHHPATKEEYAAWRHVTVEQTGIVTVEHRLARQLGSSDLLDSVDAPENPPLLLSAGPDTMQDDA